MKADISDLICRPGAATNGARWAKLRDYFVVPMKSILNEPFIYDY